MLTSVLASLALFLCRLQFFAKFGFFMMITVFLSFVYASTFFVALLAVVGPERANGGGLTGDVLRCPCTRVRRIPAVAVQMTAASSPSAQEGEAGRGEQDDTARPPAAAATAEPSGVEEQRVGALATSN